MSDTSILYTEAELLKTENGALGIGNAMKKFRDGFVLGVDPTIWDETWINNTGAIGQNGQRRIGGNTAGASYVEISMPFKGGVEYELVSKETFKFPSRFGFGWSMSQRILGYEVEMSLVGCDASGVVEDNTPIADIAISGTISVTSNVATINFATNHSWVSGDRVVLANNTDSRMNVGPVIVTVVTRNQITVPLAIANGTYTAGGSVVQADVFSLTRNAFGLLAENTTATNASFFTRRNGSTHFGTNQTIVSTAPTVGNNTPYTESFRSSGDNEFIATLEEIRYLSRTASSKSTPLGDNKYSESLPDEEKIYKLRARIKSLPNLSVPVATIASIAKTGTTTATVTTNGNHGLTTSDFVQNYGSRDITNFPNLTAQTQVASVISPTQFTIIQGGAVTASSTGGVVVRNNGSVLFPAVNLSVQSISASNNFLFVTFNTTASGTLGEVYEFEGFDSSVASYEGLYILRRLNATVAEFQKFDGTAITDLVSTNTGGAYILRTNVRFHYVRELEYTRILVEQTNARGSIDASNSSPVNITNSVTATQGIAVALGTAGLGSWTVRGGAVRIADIASAAITSTATSASISLVDIVGSHQFTVDTTAITGTNANMRARVQVSGDGGATFPFNIYDFSRVTNATDKTFMSPVMPVEFSNLRYVRTVGGTTPSVTNSVVRTIRAGGEGNRARQLNDIVLSFTAVAGTGSTEYLYVDGCRKAQMFCSTLTAITTAPVLKLQMCYADPTIATNWIDVPSATITTSSTTSTMSTIFDIGGAKFLRYAISIAGVGTTTALYDLFIKSYE